jgi:hypothetical protein
VKTYRPYAPDQSYLLPPSPGEWLPKGHLAYFILDLVAELDLGEIERRLQAKDHRGERPYAPRMMTALLVEVRIEPGPSELSVGLAESMTSTVLQAPPTSCSRSDLVEADPKLYVNRSSHARRQG